MFHERSHDEGGREEIELVHFAYSVLSWLEQGGEPDDGWLWEDGQGFPSAQYILLQLTRAIWANEPFRLISRYDLSMGVGFALQLEISRYD